MGNPRYQELLRTLAEIDGVAVAFSGGVDSTLLLAAAHEAHGDRAVAVIGRSPTFPTREHREALELASRIGATVEEVQTDEIRDPAFNTNPPDRCRACKHTLLTAVWQVARRRGLAGVVEGSNADDTGDHRPGMLAVRELEVRSPLLEVGLTKAEIREISRELGLPTWDKPSFACLASRIPYGETIDEPRLERIERAEEALGELDLGQLRVRDHAGGVARVEVEPDRIAALAAPAARERVVEALRGAGYAYVCLDLQGYRTGAMNETLETPAPGSPDGDGDG